MLELLMKEKNPIILWFQLLHWLLGDQNKLFKGIILGSTIFFINLTN